MTGKPIIRARRASLGGGVDRTLTVSLPLREAHLAPPEGMPCLATRVAISVGEGVVALRLWFEGRRCFEGRRRVERVFTITSVPRGSGLHELYEVLAQLFESEAFSFADALLDDPIGANFLVEKDSPRGLHAMAAALAAPVRRIFCTLALKALLDLLRLEEAKRQSKQKRGPVAPWRRARPDRGRAPPGRLITSEPRRAQAPPALRGRAAA